MPMHLRSEQSEFGIIRNNMKKTIILFATVCCMTAANAQTTEKAVLFSDQDDSYLLSDSVLIRFDTDEASLLVGGEEIRTLELDQDTVITDFRNAFVLKGIKSSSLSNTYYTTFYTTEGAYKVPESAAAYAARKANTFLGTNMEMNNVGSIIHKGEPVLLKATTEDITLMPSGNQETASEENLLTGTEEEKTLGADDYALGEGPDGVVFYPWEGKVLGSNRAYLTLEGMDAQPSIALMFIDEAGPDTGILRPAEDSNDSPSYNLNGVRVGKQYKGIVIKNGKKIYNK